MRVEIKFTDDEGNTLASVEGPADGESRFVFRERPRPMDKQGRELMAFDYAGLVLGDGWTVDSIPPRWLGGDLSSSPAKDNAFA